MFGLVITLDLFFYELYGIKKCTRLIEVGKELEENVEEIEAAASGADTRRSRAVLNKLHSEQRLIALLMYGTGMRLMECLRLRVKDIDFGSVKSSFVRQ